MAHTLRSEAPSSPEQSIRRHGRVHSGGSGRFTPTAVRLAPPDRTGGRPSGPFKALQWQHTWALAPMLCALALGVSTRGNRIGATRLYIHDARHALRHSERMTCCRPLPIPIHVITHHQPPIAPSPPAPSPVRFSCQCLDQPHRACTCVLLSCFPVRRRQSEPDDCSHWLLLPAHASAESCSHVIIPGFLLFKIVFQTQALLFTCHPRFLFSHMPLNEQHQLPGHIHVAFTS